MRLRFLFPVVKIVQIVVCWNHRAARDAVFRVSRIHIVNRIQVPPKSVHRTTSVFVEQTRIVLKVRIAKGKLVVSSA